MASVFSDCVCRERPHLCLGCNVAQLTGPAVVCHECLASEGAGSCYYPAPCWCGCHQAAARIAQAEQARRLDRFFGANA